MAAKLPENLSNFWNDLAEKIIDDMGKKGPGWIKDWSFDPPMNAVTGAPYHGRNRMLLTYAMRIRGTSDPRFATFQTAKKAGWRIKKGSTAVPIEKWKRFIFDVNDPETRIPQPKSPEEWDRAMSDPDIAVRAAVVGYYNVFSAEDIDGIEPYKPTIANAAIDGDLIDTLEAMSPCPVSEEPGDVARYVPSADVIRVPSRSQFASTDAMARVLLHEQAHSTAAPERCNRPLDVRFGSDAYAREELVAELASLFSATELGIRFDSIDVGDGGCGAYWDQHRSYLENWSSRFDDPAAEVRSAAGLASSASRFILEPYRSLEQKETVELGQDAARSLDRRAPLDPAAAAKAARSAAMRSANAPASQARNVAL